MKQHGEEISSYLGFISPTWDTVIPERQRRGRSHGEARRSVSPVQRRTHDKPRVAIFQTHTHRVAPEFRSRTSSARQVHKSWNPSSFECPVIRRARGWWWVQRKYGGTAAASRKNRRKVVSDPSTRGITASRKQNMRARCQKSSALWSSASTE